jgi:TorA maturation chaperone TorD
VGEFEDHLAALCETMRVLITGAPGIARQPLDEQKRLFTAHIQPWYAACLADISAAEPANFYRVAAAFAGAFLAIEALAFGMWEEGNAPFEPPLAA